MDKKNKNIVLLILSVLPIKVLIHFLIYTSKVQGIVSSKVIYHDLSYHINSIFIEKQWLFVPSIIAILIVAWFFGYFDKILLKNSVKEKLEKRIKELEKEVPIIKEVPITKSNKSTTQVKSKANPKKIANLKALKKQISLFINEMKKMPDWYQIIQARGNGHEMAKSMGIKVDDYEYWANAHKEEYMLKYNDGNLDVEGINLRIEKFGFIVTELEKVIKKAAELKLNITHDMHNDYCAARASVLGAEYALKEMTK